MNVLIKRSRYRVDADQRLNSGCTVRLNYADVCVYKGSGYPVNILPY